MTESSKQVNKKIPAKNGYQYKQQWGVLVHCNDEQHQQQVYADVKSKGLKCKVVTI